MKPAGADIQIRFQESSSPAVTAHRFGEGQAVYVAADVMGRYEEGSPFSRRWNKKAKVDQTQPVAIDMLCPSKPRSVLLQPGTEEPSWQWRSSRLQVRLLADQIQLHRIVEVLY